MQQPVYALMLGIKDRKILTQRLKINQSKCFCNTWHCKNRVLAEYFTQSIFLIYLSQIVKGFWIIFNHLDHIIRFVLSKIHNLTFPAIHFTT